MEEKPQIPKGKIQPFECENEPWVEYNLADGNTLLIKHIILKIIRAEQKNPDGSPVYAVQGHVIVNAYTPEMGYVKTKK